MIVNTTTRQTAKLPLRRLFAFALLLSAFSLSGQDIHFSQFGNSPLNLSPGLAGVFGGDMRFVGNFRQQWRRVPVPFTTYSGSVENKVYLKPGRYDKYLTASLLVDYDRQGSISLTSTQIGIPISVLLPVGHSNFFSIGVTPSFGQRGFDDSKITVDEQYVDFMFNPNNVITENLSITTLKYFDLSAGANFRLQAAKKRSRFDIGFAMHHINRPAHDFWASNVTDNEVRLYNKTTIYGLGLAQLNERFDFMAEGLYQKQGKYQEIVYGAGLRMHLNNDPYRELSLQIGVDWRHRYNNALVPRLEVYYRTWMLGATFDWDVVSRAGELISERRGGPELSLIYRLYKVKPLPKFKSCPII